MTTARGKSYISKAIVRYLELLGCPARLFNAGNKRRKEGAAGVDAKFFDAANTSAAASRERMAMETLEELLQWLHNETQPDSGCACGIFDATNTTKARRENVRRRIAQERPPVRLIFVESICNDVVTLENNYRMKLSNDDYKGTDPETAYRDFKERVRQYELVYETVDDESECRPFELLEVSRSAAPARSKGQMQQTQQTQQTSPQSFRAGETSESPKPIDVDDGNGVVEVGSENESGLPPTPGCVKLIDAGRKLVKTSCEGIIANEVCCPVGGPFSTPRPLGAPNAPAWRHPAMPPLLDPSSTFSTLLQPNLRIIPPWPVHLRAAPQFAPLDPLGSALHLDHTRGRDQE